MSGTCTAGGRSDRNRWRPIAAALRAQIRAGAYGPGDRLPSSADLQAEYRVSGQTVQHAMNALRTEGLLETRPGRGWFVASPPQVVRLARLTHPQGQVAGKSWTGCGAHVMTVLREEDASVALAAELRVAPGTEVWVRERTMRDAGEVVALATSYYPRSLTRGTVIETADTGPGGGFACLLRLGHEVVRHVERVTAGIAADDETRRFGRSDPPVVFRVVRITLGRSTVLGVIHIVVPADRFELSYELPVPS
jgi:GntR family transcriptional regulator